MAQKKMRWIVIFITFVLLFAATACGEADGSNSDTANIEKEEIPATSEPELSTIRFADIQWIDADRTEHSLKIDFEEGNVSMPNNETMIYLDEKALSDLQKLIAEYTPAVEQKREADRLGTEPSSPLMVLTEFRVSYLDGTLFLIDGDIEYPQGWVTFTDRLLKLIGAEEIAMVEPSAKPSVVPSETPKPSATPRPSKEPSMQGISEAAREEYGDTYYTDPDDFYDDYGDDFEDYEDAEDYFYDNYE